MLEIVLLWRIQYNTLYRETMIYSSMKISGTLYTYDDIHSVE